MLLPSVDAQDLALGYGPETVLDRLSFTFGAGRISVILGPGGSGKSTLLKALGADPRGAARPWVRGTLELPETTPASMPQKPHPAARTLGTLLLGSPNAAPTGHRALREVWGAVREATEFLEPVLDLPMEELTYPHQRLAEFTVAITASPLILLDEPEVGLAPEHQGWMVQRLNHLRGQRTVIVATHHLRLARSVADLAILLSNGTMVEAGQSPEFFDRPRHPRTRQFVKMGS